ncbi:hypothetical protein Patl1_27095 [Pistacia atlantica]|uniref:Uncharacterized protein n=1 Tax=Pistacia atlantica TaxID=434234 RepID=A0ACC1B4V0_9ROSI|nr:hypothetical protein Patl1_27095 [Pistacia atlantica]
MEKREDLKSVLPYLPLLVRSSTLFWPSKIVEALRSMAKGPKHSWVNSREVLSMAICDIRRSLSLFDPLAPFASMLPSLLESHYQNADDFLGKYGIKTGLRILGPQEAGIVFLSQKVLPLDHPPLFISYPDVDGWSKSVPTLCPFETYSLGSIEDHSTDTLQVDFANKYFGGGALHRGCVQEEIRFMINPELIAGMLFLPSTADNEAIEIVGVERFSDYNG